jgi:hypothetical protein
VRGGGAAPSGFDRSFTAIPVRQYRSPSGLSVAYELMR